MKWRQTVHEGRFPHAVKGSQKAVTAAAQRSWWTAQTSLCKSHPEYSVKIWAANLSLGPSINSKQYRSISIWCNFCTYLASSGIACFNPSGECLQEGGWPRYPNCDQVGQRFRARICSFGACSCASLKEGAGQAAENLRRCRGNCHNAITKESSIRLKDAERDAQRTYWGTSFGSTTFW